MSEQLQDFNRNQNAKQIAIAILNSYSEVGEYGHNHDEPGGPNYDEPGCYRNSYNNYYSTWGPRGFEYDHWLDTGYYNFQYDGLFDFKEEPDLALCGNYRIEANAMSGRYVAELASSDEASVSRGDPKSEYTHSFSEKHVERASELITRLAAKYAIRGYKSSIAEAYAKLQRREDDVADLDLLIAQV